MQEAGEAPTKSPTSNQVIALVKEVKEGRKSKEELAAALSSVKTGLDQAKEDFLFLVKKEGEAHENEFKREIDDILKAYSLYTEAIDHLLSFPKAPRPSLLDEGIEKVIFATESLIVATDLYQLAELAHGPTDIPYLNVLMKIKDAAKEGRLPADQFQNMMEHSVKYMQHAFQEVANHSDPEVTQELNMMKEAYKGHERGFQELQKYGIDHDPAHLEEGMKIITQEAEKMHEAFLGFGQKKILGTPTKFPHMNLMIQGAIALKGGTITGELFAENLKLFEEDLQKARKEFEQLCSVPTESVLIKEEIPKAMQAYDLQEEAIQIFSRYLEGEKEASLLDEGVKTLKEAGSMLYAAYEAFNEIARKESTFPCPSCSSPNPLQAKNCQKCGAVLPKIVESLISTFSLTEEGGVELGEVPVTTNVKKVWDAVTGVSEGKTSTEEFLQVLAWMEETIKESEEARGKLPPYDLEKVPEEKREDATKEKDLLEESAALLKDGHEEMLKGLEEMRLFAEDDDKIHLQEGFRSFWKGTTNVYQVQRIGEMYEKAAREQEAAKKEEEVAAMADTFTPTDTPKE